MTNPFRGARSPRNSTTTPHTNRLTDRTELERVAGAYRSGGWPAEVADDAFTAPYTAPSGGPPPWYVYRIAATSVVGVGTGAGVNGATKWTFA